VWGAGNAAYPGTHAEYVVVSSEEVKWYIFTYFHRVVDYGDLIFIIMKLFWDSFD